MKKQFSLLTSLLLLILFVLVACQKETVEKTNEISQIKDVTIYQHPAWDQASTRAACPWTIIPAGSNNVLADAIANTCEGGVIYLAAGEHTETESLIVNKSIKMVGADGAILKLPTEPVAVDPVSFTQLIEPAIHFLDAEGSLVQNINLQPINPEGGICLLFENAPRSGVIHCNITDFMMSTLIESSDQMVFINNTIKGGSAWLRGEVTEAFGIVNINGKSCYMADNEVSNHSVGIWACDAWGTLERNFFHDCFIGTLLCNVPEYMLFPDGDIIGSKVPGKGWKVRNNNATNNLHVGYLVIDGANNNMLMDNNASNNTDADIELAGDSQRFGFLTPTSYENRVVAGSYPNITIKDCGLDNQVDGGVIIDLGANPCY